MHLYFRNDLTIAGERLLSTAHCAHKLGRSVQTICSYIKTGKLKATKIYGRYLISESDLLAFVMAQGKVSL